jgi:signal transduction histidine kinase
VFDRFHRVDPSRARSSGGMGLGLAVVRELVAGMGGRVWAESEPGRGSQFVIELPAEY